MLRNTQNFAKRTLATANARTASNKVAVVEGQRTPFVLSSGVFDDYMAVDLARFAVKGLIQKTAIQPKDPDMVFYGTVIQEVSTSNVAREAALGAGISEKVPAHTVTMACISSNAAAASGAAYIGAGMADSVIVGGVETMSDVPIRFSQPLRKRMLASRKVRNGVPGYMNLLKGLKGSDFAPVAPAIAEFSTGEVMGQSSDRLAARFGVSREEQDEFAVESHLKAHKATEAGLLLPEITCVDGIQKDNGIRGESSVEKLSKMRPAFVKPHGTHTAGNSSFLTDGASAMLLMNDEKARAEGYKPKAWIKDTVWVGSDPYDELLLGPAYGISKLLAKNGLKLSDIDVWEIHEAFAGQILANMNALDSEVWCKNDGGVKEKVGMVPREKLNTLGGALALGHPFGATGCRLLTTASNRLVNENAKYAVVSACAAGGLGVAQLLENANA